MDEGKEKYDQLIRKSIQVQEHFQKRYKERVSKKSTKVLEFAADAYVKGKDTDSVKDKQIRRYLESRAEAHNSVCKIYRGFVCWFYCNWAVTVYPISNVKARAD